MGKRRSKRQGRPRKGVRAQNVGDLDDCFSRLGVEKNELLAV